MTDCRSGKTPLHLAMAFDCNKTSMEVCQILSNCNIDRQLKDGNGKLAMDYVSKEDKRLQFVVIKSPKVLTESQVSVHMNTESCKEKPSHVQKKKEVETHEERKKSLEQKKEVKTCEERKKMQKEAKTHEQKKEIKSKASQKRKGCKVSLL